MTTPPPPPSGTPTSAARLALGIGAVVALGLYALQIVRFFPYVNDDAYITFRYARNLADGIGPYCNAGEHVEGCTNHSLLLACAAVYKLAGEAAVPVFAKWLGIVSGAIGLLLVFPIARAIAPNLRQETRGHIVLGAAVSLVAAFPGYAVNAVSGLETTFLGAVLACGVWLSLRAEAVGAWRGAGLAFALGALSRPEVGLFTLFTCGVAAIARRMAGGPFWPRRATLDVSCILAVLASQVALRWFAYDGELVPNTYYAKQGGFWGFTPWQSVFEGAIMPFGGYVGVGLIGVGLWLARRHAPQFLPLTALAGAGAILPLLVGSDWMLGWRFTVPYLPVLAVVCAIAWRHVVAVMPRFERDLTIAVACLPLVMYGVHDRSRREYSRQIEMRAEGYRDGHRALATWVEQNVKAGETVALMDIGIVSYYCPRHRILDLVGLTDRFIAKSKGGFLQKEYDPAYVLDQKPAVIVPVLSCPYPVGQPKAPVADPRILRAFTPPEERLVAHPRFVEEYRSKERTPAREAPWQAQLAATLGAQTLFQHLFPDLYYLLPVFVRQSKQ